MFSFRLQRPSFLLLDGSTKGAGLKAVDELNGLRQGTRVHVRRSPAPNPLFA